MEKLNVPQLRDYLKKYGITTGHRKDVLIALANAVVKLKLEPDPDFQHDCRPETSIKQCLKDLHCHFEDPFSLTYTSDFSLVPDFGLYDIFNYLLFHRSDYDRRKLKAFKSFEDYRLFYDGHVLDLQYCDISDASNLCAFKSKVKPTQKDSSYLGKPTYHMWFLMEKSTAVIKLAFCECPGGADGACRHIAASLYALEDFEKPSVTSGPCLWKRRALSQTEAVPIKKLRIEAVGYGKEKQEMGEDEFDPRHPEDRQSLSQEAKIQFLDELTEVAPDTVALQLLSDKTNLPEMGQGEHGVDRRIRQLSIVSRAQELATGNSHPADVMQKLVYTADDIDYIEKKTCGQSSNENWHYIRKGIITASLFKRIDSRARTLRLDPAADPSKAVDCVLGRNTADLDTQPAIVWGRKKEKAARKAYIAIERKQHKKLSLTVPGLQLSQAMPHIGGSADGIVSCKCHGRKLMEIKCPYSLRDKSPKEAACATLGCENKDGVWTVTERCEYYPQIQGLMGIYGLRVCDLVIYTSSGIMVIPVQFNEDFFYRMLQNLNYFYMNYVIPELFKHV